MPQIDLIIFDCDGVLVDSEYLVAKIGSQLLKEIGYKISPKELSKRYSGLVFQDTLQKIEQEIKKPISANFIDQMERLFRAQMKTELRVINGIKEAIEIIKSYYPYCICSNTMNADIKDMLKTVNLYHLFENKIFSAPEVGTKKQKPAPDVFLFAAQELRVKPENTIVVEDSIHGVYAAATAGMRVIGFTGGSHSYLGHSNALIEAGAETVITKHAHLLETLEAMKIWRDSQ
ncbi:MULTISPECIES: HAD family hydrolase [unclassified Bartonella]|uniref:HAD family hydrolase n=1 Tax=unclassified Bartonella TaxID=2645622 RepID=UPI000999E2E9|nr:MULTISPECIES: HAD family phosphatase [unclassified Bartonella]AQX27637.1 haloacid dehalogenase superfamily, subfamily IA,variant 3 with third motif having DD or ED [Bartonella sp. JB15]AQX28918.1 haloacid dehalogenase superfamily, subfamily IA,variant 3 with third motif having DD or ED [Bartonella sp. JB63]